MDPAGLARGQAPGPQPGRQDRSRRRRRGCHSSPGMLIRSNTTSSQPDPARSMTRIRDPIPGTPGHIKSSGRPGKLKGLRQVLANPAAIWMTWRPAASVPAPTPRSVVWRQDEAAARIFCHVWFPAAGRQRGFQQYVPPYCPASPGEDACVASQPGQPARRARPGARRPGDGGVIAVARAAGSGTASARGARAACSRQLPGRSPRSRQVQLLPGWPVSHSSPRPPVVAPALPWA